MKRPRVILFVISALLMVPAHSQDRNLSKMYELPAYTGTPFFYSGYTVLFNTKTNTPDWVAWKLDKSRLGNVRVSRGRDTKFKADPNLGVLSPKHNDYTNTPYDRGHMCPANDCLQSGEALLESFYMSNVCPQRSSLNRNSWATLEDKCHTWILDNFFSTLYIVCGPIPDEIDSVIITQDRHIVAPKRFFKAIIGEKTRGGYSGIAFVFEQSGKVQTMSIDALELIIHKDLFSNMPRRIASKAEKMQPNLHDWPSFDVIRGK